MMDSSTSTAPNKEISCAVSRRPPSSSGHSRLSLDLLIRYIDNVLSAINNQGFGFKVIERGTELRDLVQPVASDFSQLFEGISEGAKIFSDQNFFKSRLSTEAHSMAVDVLKGLGNAHWVAVGLLAIANVLERFDNISANDRECIDLLKAMLKLGKYLKQMKDLNVKMHKEVLDDMCEAVQLIVSGAILCRSFITSNKLSKFFLTKKIRDELVYIRGKVNAMKADLMGHMQLLIMRTLTFIHEQYITGRNDENYCLGVTEQYQSNDIEREMEQSSKTELDGSDSNTVSSQGQDNCNDINGHQQLELPLRTSLGLGKFFRKKIRTILRWRPKDFSYLEHQMLLKDIQSSQIEFKRKELIKATKGFKKKIGEGAVGIVYQGNLSDGRQVAVKVVSNISSQSKREWMNELSTLTKLQHRNIVELVGYCFEDDLMLVYDYMPRNLERIILGKDEMIIDWPTRHSIILDIIRGLKHLHDGCIVHRDIKPSNILLDQNLNAKISDFGIARILQPGNAKMEISTDGVSLEDIINFSSETTHITGTVGYLDPEYLQTYCVTLRSDIYSFGVLMLNVVSGKKTVFHTNGEMHYLPPEAWRLHEEDRLTELIDPRLINTEGLINSSSIIRTVKIALWCIKEESKMRPSASRVLKMLSSVEEIPSPTPDQSFYENYSKDKISSCISSSGKSSIAESSVADDLSSDQEVSILTSPVGGHFLEEMILSPTLPLELSSADYNLSQEENWIPPFPPILSSADYNFLREENWIATPPIKSSVADDHYSEEKIPTSIPPVESLVIEDHSSEEEIHIASPPVGSVVTYGDSFVKKIEESDRKWSGASLITLRMLCVFSLVSFICISRMFTILSPLYSSFQ